MEGYQAPIHGARRGRRVEAMGRRANSSEHGLDTFQPSRITDIVQWGVFYSMRTIKMMS